MLAPEYGALRPWELRELTPWEERELHAMRAAVDGRQGRAGFERHAREVNDGWQLDR